MGTADRTAERVAHTSDAALVAAGSFDLIFSRHVDAIYGYVVRRVGLSLAEEITAETFARAFERRTRFVSTHESARPWLYGIATNLIHNEWRAERRRLAAFGRAAAMTPLAFDETERADSKIDASASAARVAPTLLELEPGDRDALLLFAWQDLTYEEVAIALQIPVGTVASRINRARRRIQASLGKHTDIADGDEVR